MVDLMSNSIHSPITQQSTQQPLHSSKKIPLLLIGGGGHCRSCIDVIEATADYEIVGIVEADNYQADEYDRLPYPVVGTDADLPQLITQAPHCLITIGQIKQAGIRQEKFKQLKKLGAILPTVISPLAYVSSTAKIGEGSIIMHQSLVNSYVQVGDNCIINSQSLLEHDCLVANHSHISTAAKLNGQVSVGEGCLIGSGTLIKQGVQIADQVIIGMGSRVLNDIEQAGTYTGLIK